MKYSDQFLDELKLANPTMYKVHPRLLRVGHLQLIHFQPHRMQEEKKQIRNSQNGEIGVIREKDSRSKVKEEEIAILV